MEETHRGSHLPAPDDPRQAFRFEQTMRFVGESLNPPAGVLDLGEENALSARMREAGYSVLNTRGDLDFEHEQVRREDVDAVTAFEVLEHLVGPFGVLRAIGAPRLFATVPLRLWFAPAYRNPSDPWDRHFHEFEPWQFDWLLEKAGWEIVRSERWVPKVGVPLGIRPLLRRVTPRWYAVEAVRRKG